MTVSASHPLRWVQLGHGHDHDVQRHNPDAEAAVLVAQPGSLLAATNNTGISNDSNVGQANFDGGGASYSAQALAAQGWTPGATNTVDGVKFTWPQSTPGWPDNVIAQGQNITVNAPSGTQTLAFLGSATNGPSEGVVTEHYCDGSSAQYWLGLSDWTLNGGNSQPSYGNQTAIELSYRNCSYCSPPQQTVATYVFYAAVPVDPGKTLTSVTLPTVPRWARCTSSRSAPRRRRPALPSRAR